MDFRNNRDKGIFDTDLAVEFGVEAATVVERFRMWVQFNQSQDRNYKDGRYWTFNSLEGLVREFPWLKNKDKTSRLMGKLVQSGVLLKGFHAVDRNDRRTWYAFTDEYANLLNLGISQNCEGASQNCEKDVSNVRNGLRKNAKCNVRDNPEITQTKKKGAGSTPAATASDQNPVVSHAELTSEQSEWLAKAEQYVDPVAELTLGALEQLPELPKQIPVKPLLTQLRAVDPELDLPLGLFVAWLVSRNCGPTELMMHVDQTITAATAQGVPPAAVLLYSLEVYRDSSVPPPRRTLRYPRAPGPITDSQPSARSARAARAAPAREHVA